MTRTVQPNTSDLQETIRVLLFSKNDKESKVLADLQKGISFEGKTGLNISRVSPNDLISPPNPEDEAKIKKGISYVPDASLRPPRPPPPPPRSYWRRGTWLDRK